MLCSIEVSKALDVLEPTMCLTKRKAEGEPVEAPLPKRGKRIFIKVILHWVTVRYGVKTANVRGTFE
jgi:hypothetical protein